MAQGLAHLSKEYVGRGIGYGKDHDGNEVGLYFVTGRSDPSRRRTFKILEQGSHLLIKVDRVPEDKDKPLPTDHALIYYNAIRLTANERIITNGAQTDLLATTADYWQTSKPRFLLDTAFHEPHHVTYVKDGVPQKIDLTSFEPDPPNYTTRISVAAHSDQAAFSELRPDSRGTQIRRVHNVTTRDLERGLLNILTTYDGKNVPQGAVIPRFNQAVVSTLLPKGNIEDLADMVYRMLAPKQPGHDIDGNEIVSPGADFRVGVVTFRYNPSNQHYTGVILQKAAGETSQIERFSGVAA